MNTEKTTLDTTRNIRRVPAVWLAALAGTLILALTLPAIASAATEESNPNERNCHGQIRTGWAEPGYEEEHPVKYTFHCDGPITGYQITSQVPVTGLSEQPDVLTLPSLTPTADVFSCSSEIPSYAFGCVTGAASKSTTVVTKEGNIEIRGQFYIGTAACKTPQLDPKLTVVYATSEGTFAHNEKGELETVKTKVIVKNKEGEEIEVEGYEPKYETKTGISGPINLGHTAYCPPPGKRHHHHRGSRHRAKHAARR